MPSILALPTELVIFVLDNLDRLRDLAALARINRRLYDVVNPILYKRAVSRDFPYPLEWAAHNGVIGTLLKVLDSGADPNHEFHQCTSSREWRKALTQRGQLHPGWDTASLCDSRSTLLAGSNGSSYGVQNMAYDDDESMSDFTDDGDNYTNHEPMFYSPTLDGDGRSVGRNDDSDGSGRWAQTKFGRRYTALHLAARAGHIGAISTLLKRGARMDVVAKQFCSCWREYGILTSMEGTASIDGLYIPGWTPLHVAICHGNEQAAIKLLASGAPVSMELFPPWENSGFLEYPATALHHAAAMGLVHVIRYLVDVGLQADIDVRDNKTLTPFYYAYAYRRWDSTVPLLLDLGANINVDIDIFLPYSTITPLGEACRVGNYEDADRLIELGADVNRGYIATNIGNGLTPLHMCAMPPAKGRRFAMLSAGGDNNVEELETREQEYARAVKHGLDRMQTIEKLVAHGAALETRDCPGDTPLIAAVQHFNVPAIKALIKAGADIHATNSRGRNVLMQAIDGPPLPISSMSPRVNIGTLSRVLRELLNNGARIDHRDNQGNNLLHVVCKCSQERLTPDLQCDILRLVLNIPGAAALMQAREDSHESLTPLMVAFTEGRLLCCDVLVRRGCWGDNNNNPQRKEDLAWMANRCYLRNNNPDQHLMHFLLDLDVDGYLATDPQFAAYILHDLERGWVRHSGDDLFDPQRPVTFLGERLYNRSILLRGPDELDEDVLGKPREDVKAWCTSESSKQMDLCTSNNSIMDDPLGWARPLPDPSW